MLMETADTSEMIRDSVGAIAPRGGDLKRIRNLRSDPTGIDKSVWQQIVELGWLALRLEGDQGGLGLGLQELCAIAGELGAALVPEPVLPVAASVTLLDEQTRDKVLGGSLIVVPAWRNGLASAGLLASPICSDGRVTGRKVMVPSAAAADAFVVTVEDGAVLVDRNAEGVKLTVEELQDGGQLATLEFKDTPFVRLAGDAGAVVHDLSLGHSAYLLGAAERAFEMTLEYLGIRQQFGRPIGAFQVLQHRAAEAKIQLALSRAVLDEAIQAVDQSAGKTERVRTGARAIARVADTAMLIARESVQMHGAIGITDEHDIGLYCRKILSIYNQFGSASSQRARYLASIAEEAR